ncbi:MAG TPA: mannosyltransferase family protein [Candidatus Bathyarchaeia archaeon]|nr:mannosyltransferase family protein [Candidatus Bathyarchaeia archaeon]
MVVLRIFCVTILYTFLSPAASVHSTLQNAFYIFAAWDSEHYISIAQSWYPSAPALEWAFFPLYPAIVRCLSVFGLDFALGALIVATVSGLISIVVFQKIADFYLSRDLALVATLVYFMLPPVFVFSAVMYSEPEFLLFSMLSWYFCIRGKHWKSSLAASMTSLVRPYGVLIVIPIALEYLRHREYRKLVYCTVPVFTLAGWMMYSILMTRTIAPIYGQGTFLTANRDYYPQIQEALREILQGHMSIAVSKLVELAYEHVIVLSIILVSLVLVIIFLLRVIKTDRALGVYAILSVSVIFFIGLLTSIPAFPRYFAFIFPIGLALHTRKTKALLVSLTMLAVLDCLFWYAFLTDSFY